ncbi:hypothetical protein SFRURICE_020009 [Spodoptera frugiperda]|nr:hypothetical protein SFRURICE_020009 [Spodoptera frugiperda]
MVPNPDGYKWILELAGIRVHPEPRQSLRFNGFRGQLDGRRSLLNKSLPLSPPRRSTSHHLHPLAPCYSGDIVGPPNALNQA